MEINESVLQRSERDIFALREVYLRHGFCPYRMSKFEEYDLYARNKDFLVSDNVITFTDTDGKLMALKPDVTLSLIKNSIDEPEQIKKVFYNENVYRVSKGSGAFKEIMQAGVECFGKVDESAVCEVLKMAAESLRIFSKDSVLAISNIDVINEFISKITDNNQEKAKIYKAVADRNLFALDDIDCDKKDLENLKELVSIYGGIEEVVPQLKKLGVSDEAFFNVLEDLEKSEFADIFRLDFSVTDDINYYNTIVFKGFIRNIPVPVLSGGQYDKLMAKMRRKSKAIGFAVYTDELEYIEGQKVQPDDDFINIALPKGRLGENVYKIFAKAGFDCPSILEENRKLIFENPENKIRFFWVKPSDVAIYVQRGAADLGVAGKDILLEYEPDVDELLDLKMGKCKMAVAGLNGFKDDQDRTLRVSTKFTRIAQNFYQSKGRDIDIIHLNGSIELAPILGLSDVIVDIVETGTTLKENNLSVVETIVDITARLISNKASYKFKSERIEKIVGELAKQVE